MFVPLRIEVRAWFAGTYAYQFLTADGPLPNYSVGALAVAGPYHGCGNDNDQVSDPVRALILAQRTRRELGLTDGINRNRS